MHAGTHDVQNFTATSSSPNSMSLSARYAVNSPATGVLFALLLVGSTRVDFTRSVYLALDRDQSAGVLPFVQGSLWGGPYQVLAYDIESDGIPGLGSISSAGTFDITIEGQSKWVQIHQY